MGNQVQNFVRRFGIVLGVLVLVALLWIAVIQPRLANVEVQATPTPTPTPTPAPVTVVSAVTVTAPATSTPQDVEPQVSRAPTKQVSRAARETLKVYFLDVGQGDSILLRGPDFTILIDTGRHNRSEVVPLLERIGVEEIDLLVGTHPDSDHIGQFPQVLARFPVDEVWMSGGTSLTRIFERTVDAIAESGAGYHEPRLGETYELGSARIEVLHPEELTGESNEDSIVFRLVYGNVAFMFTGDAEIPSEEAMVATERDLHAQILKLGHHGSNTSSTQEFLEAVDPELAIWSAGIDNTYGHPSPATLARLAQMDVRVLGTAEYGTIVLVTDGREYHLEDFDPTDDIAPAWPVDGPAAGCWPGQININTASYIELQEIAQIGPTRARSLIELRPFASIEDMDRIPGISLLTIEQIQEQGLACVE